MGELGKIRRRRLEVTRNEDIVAAGHRERGRRLIGPL